MMERAFAVASVSLSGVEGIDENSSSQIRNRISTGNLAKFPSLAKQSGASVFSVLSPGDYMVINPRWRSEPSAESRSP
jgi:hypothetical protein